MLAIRQEASANRHGKQDTAAVTQMFRKETKAVKIINARWNFSMIKFPLVC
jgi:hypothetical protein